MLYVRICPDSEDRPYRVNAEKACTFSTCAFSREDYSDRGKQNLYVHRQGVLFNVSPVVGPHEKYARVVMAGGYLPKSSNSRAHTGARHGDLRKRAQHVWMYGPRAHKAHVTNQYIDQLWEFIETSAAQEVSDGCDPSVILRFRENSPFKQLNFLLFGWDRPELRGKSSSSRVTHFTTPSFV